MDGALRVALLSHYNAQCETCKALIEKIFDNSASLEDIQRLCKIMESESLYAISLIQKETDKK